MRPGCEKLGLSYIALDIERDRNILRAVQELITQEE